MCRMVPLVGRLGRAFWKKNSYSGGNGSCVDATDLGIHVAVRDSKDKSGSKAHL